MIKIIVTLEEKDGRVSMFTNQPPTIATLKEMEAVKLFMPAFPECRQSGSVLI